MCKHHKDKDLNRLVKEMIGKGWRHEMGSKHHRLIHPSGRAWVGMSNSPSCPYAKKHIEAEIRRLEASMKTT